MDIATSYFLRQDHRLLSVPMRQQDNHKALYQDYLPKLFELALQTAMQLRQHLRARIMLNLLPYNHVSAFHTLPEYGHSRDQYIGNPYSHYAPYIRIRELSSQ